MTKDDQVLVTIDRSCVNITLNRPHVGNALNASMVNAINSAMDFAARSQARLIVFRGTGRHLCTGFDFSDLDEATDGDLLLRFVRIEQLLQKIFRSDVVTAAIASGRTYGAGADLFAACDRRIGLPGATFAFPGPNFGLVLGTRRLSTRLGVDSARRTLIEGGDLSVCAASRLGLVTDACAQTELPSLLEGLVASASRLSADTIRELHAVTVSRDDDCDLAALVKSASPSGLKDRIVRYRDQRARETKPRREPLPAVADRALE